VGGRLIRRSAAAAAALLLAVPATGSAEPVAGDRRVFVVALAASADAVYSVERRIGCETACDQLARTVDGGRTWRPLPARGWATAEVSAVAVGGRTTLLAPGADGVQLSDDGGATFTATGPPAAAVEVARDGSAFVAGPGGAAYVLRLPSRRVDPLPSPGLGAARVVPHPAYPDVPAGQPVAVVAGRDPKTGFPVVARCDARWDCATRSVVVPREDAPRAYLSPAFARDRTLYVTLATGGLYRSADGGATFAPVTVAPPRPGAVVTTYPSLAFSSDHDARAGTGSVYVTVLDAATGTGDPDALSGGVFAATPGGPWRRLEGAGPPGSGATAVTVTGTGVVHAAYLAPPSGGVVCASPGRGWRTSCMPETAAPQRIQGRPSTTAAPADPDPPPRSAATAGRPAPHSPTTTATPAARERPRSRNGSSWLLLLGVLAGGTSASAMVLSGRRRGDMDKAV